jgi:hypothetical protein
MFMLRVTVVGLALTLSVVACTKQDRNAANTETAGGMAPAGTTSTGGMAPSTTDTMGAMAPGSTATSSAGGAIDTMSNRAGAAMDTMAQKAGGAANKAKAAAGAGAAAVGSAASSAALRTKLATLSSDQVKQLQQALNNDGCDVGTPDGTMGAKTRQGVQCSLQKHNIPDTNVDSLYRVLNLNFGS